jgi:nucleotide-binding universal stress UspA family protein
MNTFLVAIDFSKNAEHALEYALMYAKKLDAEIYLLWVDNTISEESVIDTIEGDLRREKKSYMKELIKKCKPLLNGNKIDVLFRKGRVYQEVTKAARQIGADLIFVGTHGVSGFEQYWIGSNAYRIVTQAPCPVVSIRSDFRFKDSLKNILLPIDSSLETRQKLPFACEIALKFDAVVHLLVLYNTPLSVVRKRIDKITEEAKKCMLEKEVKYVVERLEADNVAASILDYAEGLEIDLITIMTDQGTTTANKYLGPYSQQLINNSLIPIMSLRAKEHHE